MSGSRRSSQQGFTIIEVLIVLVIAMLIFTIVFFAVPAMQRQSRNTDRTRFVEFAATQMEQYYVHHGLKYPNDPNTMCAFIIEYLEDNNPDMDTCVPSFDEDKNCVLVTGGRYTICYHDRTIDHGYMGPEDEISFALAHNCNADAVASGEPTENPIFSSGGTTDTDVKHYVIWTELEGGALRCVDNFRNYD